mmetsp:Transcript_10260/g.42422  ORF Transcript_10260/g.42422 Transcript_10260/m.42422 type:complete len:205 (+) Transcript_10260:215-829(+)
MSKYSCPRSFDVGAFDANALSSATYPSSSRIDSAPSTILATYSENGTTGVFNRAVLFVRNTVARTRRSPGTRSSSAPPSSSSRASSPPASSSPSSSPSSSSSSSPPRYPGGSATTTSISLISYPISHRRTAASSVLDTRCTVPSAPRVRSPSPASLASSSTASSRDAYPPRWTKTSLRPGALATALAVGPMPRRFRVYGLMFAP